MAGTLQPLDRKFAIADARGNPTEYFIRWAQQRQIDISDGITLQDLIDYLTAHALQEGSGIQITPNGQIPNMPTIAADVQEILDQVTATRGAIIYRGLLGWSALLPGTVGFFLKTNGAGADPAWAAGGGSGAAWDFSPPLAAAFTLFSGDATAAVLSDDTDLGLKVTTGAAAGTAVIRGGYKALPAVGTDFSVVMKARVTTTPNTFQAGGLTIYESATGKSHSVLLFESAANDSVRRQTIAGAFNSDVKYAFAISAYEAWMKIARVGTNLIFSRSADGKNWATLQSIAQNTYLTTAPDRIGPVVWLAHATDIPVLTVPYWLQAGF